MAVIGVRKTTWNNLSEGRQFAFRVVARHVGITTTPPTYRSPTNAQWYVAEDTRWDLEDIAYLACIAANITDIPANWQPPQLEDGEGNPTGEIDWPEVRRLARQFMAARIVWPVTINDGDDPYQTVLAAQGAPAAFQAADHIPDGWTVME